MKVKVERKIRYDENKSTIEISIRGAISFNEDQKLHDADGIFRQLEEEFEGIKIIDSQGVEIYVKESYPLIDFSLIGEEGAVETAKSNFKLLVGVVANFFSILDDLYEYRKRKVVKEHIDYN